jgi:hypothetical protein
MPALLFVVFSKRIVHQRIVRTQWHAVRRFFRGRRLRRDDHIRRVPRRDDPVRAVAAARIALDQIAGIVARSPRSLPLRPCTRVPFHHCEQMTCNIFNFFSCIYWGGQTARRNERKGQLRCGDFPPHLPEA